MWYESDNEIVHGPVEQHPNGHWYAKGVPPHLRIMVIPFETKEEAIKHAKQVLKARAKTAIEMFHKAMEKKKKFIESYK